MIVHGDSDGTIIGDPTLESIVRGCMSPSGSARMFDRVGGCWNVDDHSPVRIEASDKKYTLVAPCGRVI